MGPHVLGWGALLFAGRYRNSQAHWKQERFGGRVPRHSQAGGTIESDWPLMRALEIGDRATGVAVLRELYDKMKAAPAPVDLNALWKELGVERRNGKIEFNNGAPLAPMRRAITQPAPR
jgi:hypothetical protein